MLITMIHVFYKLLEIYHNILFFYLLYIELQNCSVNIKRVYNNILSYNRIVDGKCLKIFSANESVNLLHSRKSRSTISAFEF